MSNLLPPYSPAKKRENLHRTSLLWACGLPNKLPEGEAVWHAVPCYGWGGMKFMGIFQVHLLPQEKGKRKHRLYVTCTCGKLVPAGRWGQHKCGT